MSMILFNPCNRILTNTAGTLLGNVVVLIHSAIYCGAPAAQGAFRADNDDLNSDNDNDGIDNICESTPNGDFTCSTTTASNYAHVLENRATTNSIILSR